MLRKRFVTHAVQKSKFLVWSGFELWECVWRKASPLVHFHQCLWLRHVVVVDGSGMTVRLRSETVLDDVRTKKGRSNVQYARIRVQSIHIQGMQYCSGPSLRKRKWTRRMSAKRRTEQFSHLNVSRSSASSMLGFKSSFYVRPDSTSPVFHTSNFAPSDFILSFPSRGASLLCHKHAKCR